MREGRPEGVGLGEDLPLGTCFEPVPYPVSSGTARFDLGITGEVGDSWGKRVAALLGEATPAVLGPLLKDLFTLTANPAGFVGAGGGTAAAPADPLLPPIAS